jgi:hypothetical protein
MPKPPPPSPAIAEPRVHRKNVIGFRAASEELWGRGVYEQIVAALPPDVQRATAGLRPMEPWVPEGFIAAWAEAVWRGPARCDEAQMRRYVGASVAHGFGRVRRFFLQIMTPEAVVERAVALWREEHTTGVLRAELHGVAGARVQLSDHPYVETPVLRLALGEALRYIVGLTRARNVTEAHNARGNPLIIDIKWDRDVAT